MRLRLQVKEGTKGRNEPAVEIEADGFVEEASLPYHALVAIVDDKAPAPGLRIAEIVRRDHRQDRQSATLSRPEITYHRKKQKDRHADQPAMAMMAALGSRSRICRGTKCFHPTKNLALRGNGLS